VWCSKGGGGGGGEKNHVEKVLRSISLEIVQLRTKTKGRSWSETKNTTHPRGEKKKINLVQTKCCVLDRSHKYGYELGKGSVSSRLVGSEIAAERGEEKVM